MSHEFYVQLYDREIANTKKSKKPFLDRLAHRAGVGDGVLTEHNKPTDASDFAKGMSEHRWAQVGAHAERWFPLCVPRAYAPVFEQNIGQGYGDVSVAGMFDKFEMLVDSWHGNTLEKFAEEFNVAVAAGNKWLEDTDRPRKYKTRIETQYTGEFEEAVKMMQNQVFWGVVTERKAGDLHAIQVTGSKKDLLIGRDTSAKSSCQVFADNFVSLVIPVVVILEARNPNDEVIPMDFCELASAALEELDMTVPEPGAERRRANDGNFYSKAEFQRHYQSLDHWEKAKPTLPQEAACDLAPSPPSPNPPPASASSAVHQEAAHDLLRGLRPPAPASSPPPPAFAAPTPNPEWTEGKYTVTALSQPPAPVSSPPPPTSAAPTPNPEWTEGKYTVTALSCPLFSLPDKPSVRGDSVELNDEVEVVKVTATPTQVWGRIMRGAPNWVLLEDKVTKKVNLQKQVSCWVAGMYIVTALSCPLFSHADKTSAKGDSVELNDEIEVVHVVTTSGQVWGRILRGAPNWVLLEDKVMLKVNARMKLG